MSEERRKLRRHDLLLEVAYRSNDIDATGILGNIHAEGLFIRCEKLPDPFDPVVVVMTAQEGYQFEVEGIVRWTTSQFKRETSSPGFGVQLHKCIPVFRQQPGGG